MAQSQETKITMHDRLFKEFFRRFLERFMWLFYPIKAARLDWSKLEFIAQEQIVNFPGQALRITDVAARVPVNEADTPAFLSSVDDNIDKREPKTDDEKPPDPKEEVILVHIDVEANKPKPVPHRMHEYYSLYRIIENKPVLPIALITKGRSTKPEVKPEQDRDNNQIQVYTERLWEEELLRFRYYEVVLQDLLSEEYLDLNDPVAAALAVLMKHPEEISALIKKRSLETILGDEGITDGDKHFLERFVHEYVPNETVRGGSEEVMKYLEDTQLSFWERLEKLAEQRAEQRTQKRAEIEIRQNVVLEMLQEKFQETFQEIAEELTEQIRAIEDSEILSNIIKQVMFIQTPSELVLPEPA